MKSLKLRKVYFLGIGGIGMSALARYLNNAGTIVQGYDKTPTSLTKELEREGIKIHYDDQPELITPDIDLIVYTPAIPKDLKEYVSASESSIQMMKRSELLEQLTREHETLAVAGTHGKTTVSTMLAHILFSSPIGCTAFLGGIAKNYNSNLLLNYTSQLIVTEADEFDRSFLRLHPKLAVITSTDADHLDIYSNHKNLLTSFTEFTQNIVHGGILVIKSGVSLPLIRRKDIQVFTYSLSGDTDYFAKDIELKDGLYNFKLATPAGEIEGFKPILPGLFNVENCIAASAAALLSGVDKKDVLQAANTFSGVKRRFDHRIQTRELVYIDDYAHHPEELNACISSVRKLYPHRKITGIFQPHLFSRTRDFADQFASSLELLDELILLDIYPAREKPIEGISSEMLIQKTNIKYKSLLKREEVIDYLKKHKPDVLLTLGAGDIDQLVPEIENFLLKKQER